MNFENVIKVFKLDEGDGPPGMHGKAYQDSKGYWTIGRGHLIGAKLTDLKISQHIIEELFKEDFNEALEEAVSVMGQAFFDSLEEPRKVALVTMLYTLGRHRFLLFHETISAMKRRNWDEVSNRILSTKWARDVDPKQQPGKGRDDRIAYMFKTGDYHPDYGITS